MRNAVLTLCAGLGLLAVAGCAQRTNPAISSPPATYELPNIPQAQRQHMVNAQVEGGGRRPRAQLVPEFKPAQPTPEEQKILGKPQEYVYLPYPVPGFSPESHVYSRFGGAETAIHGTGGAEALYGMVLPSPHVYSGWGGAVGAISTFPARVGAAGGTRAGVGAAGGAGALRGGAETGISSEASEIAQQRRTVDPG